MRKEYDLSRSVRNPYLRKLKKVISIRVDTDTIEYFEKMAVETGIPPKDLMNHLLGDRAARESSMRVFSRGASRGRTGMSSMSTGAKRVTSRELDERRDDDDR